MCVYVCGGDTRRANINSVARVGGEGESPSGLICGHRFRDLAFATAKNIPIVYALGRIQRADNPREEQLPSSSSLFFFAFPLCLSAYLSILASISS